MDVVERTAAAVAEGYRTLDLSAAAGLLLYNYWDGEPEQLAPLAYELRAGEVTPSVGLDGSQRELGYPEVERDPRVFELCQAMNRRILDEYAMFDVYWLTLANHLHTLLGIPVLVAEVEMPIAEQLRRQVGELPDDPLAGLDIAVSLWIDEHRVAAVWRDEMSHSGSAHVPDGDPWPVGWNTLLGTDPEVRAGWMAPGATGVSLRDRAGVWHPARNDLKVWLCALPQRASQEEPPVVFLDVEGNEFQFEVETTGLPGLWPKQAHGAPRLTQRSADVVGYSDGDWYVFVEAHAGFEDTLFLPMPGTVLGRPHGFGLERRGREWRAVAVCGSFTVDVQGEGDPPARLDLETVA